MSIIQSFIGTNLTISSGSYSSWTVEWFNKGISPQIVGAPRIFAVNSYPNESIAFSSEGFDYAWVGGAPGISTGVNSTDESWQHWAMVSDGTDLGVFRNGQRLVYQPRVRMVDESVSSLYIGISSDPGTGYHGYITNFRIVKGQAMYDPTQGTITVPSVPLTNNANTELLLLAADGGSVTTDSSSRVRTPWGSGGLEWSSQTPFTALGPYSQSSNQYSTFALDFSGANYNADLLNVTSGWTVTDGGSQTGTTTTNAVEISPGYIRIGVSFNPTATGTWTFTQPVLGGSIKFFANGINYGYIGYDAGIQWALDVV